MRHLIVKVQSLFKTFFSKLLFISWNCYFFSGHGMPENRTNDDFGPCTFSDGVVNCQSVTILEIKRIFCLTTHQILSGVTLNLPSTELFIPSDILANKKTVHLEICYPFRSSKVRIDHNAFRSTKDYTDSITLNIMDCIHLDLRFLSGFSKLTQFQLSNIDNIQSCFPTLPPLPSLSQLWIVYPTADRNEIRDFPVLAKGLKWFIFGGFFENGSDEDEWQDTAINRIVDWLLCSSVNTLETLEISRLEKVTRVPPQIGSFKALQILNHHELKNLETIRKGDFSFSLPVKEVFLNSNGIKEIEPGAFQGITIYCCTRSFLYCSISHFLR